MPIVIPGELPKSRKREKKAAPVRVPKSVQREANSLLTSLITPMIAEVTAGLTTLSPLANAGQAVYVIGRLLDRWNQVFGASTPALASQWVSAVDQESRTRLEKSLARAFGVDRAKILDEPSVMESMMIANAEAADLIKTIPADYIGKVAKAVYAHYRGEELPENRTLTQEIQELGKITHERAKVIARDQTSKMNASLNQVRQTSLGIDRYIWRTAEDSRVVGNPGGLYPDGNRMHGNHYQRNGKVFEWAKPPFDGPPGFAINCRCISIPIIDKSTIKVQ